MRRVGLPLALALFLLSGATSLVDQVVWLKYLSYTFGNTTQAAAILLSVFMGGLAGGAYVFGRRRTLTDPIALYAALEGAIGLLALLSPLFFTWIDEAYTLAYRGFGSQPLLFVIVRGAIAALLLLPPTLLMGGTLPLLARAFESDDDRGRITGWLYSLNTWGAVIGTLAATWFLIPRFGLRQTLAISAAVNFAIVLVVALRLRGSSASAPTRVGSEPMAPPAAGTWLVVAGAVGAIALGYEVIWTRILVFYLGSSVYAFGTMLAAHLIGIAAGAAVIALLVARLPPAVAFTLCQLAIGAGTLLQVLLVPGLPDRMARIAALFPNVTEANYGITILSATALLLLPTTLVSGAAFPIAVRLISPSGEAGHGVGRVYSANTLGAILGSLVAGFVLIPTLGSQGALLALAGTSAAIGAWAALLAGRRILVVIGVGGVIAIGATAMRLAPDHLLRPSGFLSGPKASLLEFREDSTAAVAVRRVVFPDGPALSIEINGVNVAGGSADLVAIQKLQGHIPMLVHGHARRVLHIGFGSGGTAYAVTRHPIEQLVIAELSPSVLAASHAQFSAINHGVLDDPRVRVEIVDGRNLVLASDERFDVILSDSIHPRYAGNGSLYSEDYFRLCRARLAPGGVISMWLPIYSLTETNLRQILRAFVDVFPATTVWYPATTLNPFLVVVGTENDLAIDVATIVDGYDQPAIARELGEIGYADPAALLAEIVVAGPRLQDYVAAVEPHRDDRPVVEYESGRVLERNRAWLACFRSILGQRTGPAPALRASRAVDPELLERIRRLAAERRQLLRVQYETLYESVRSGHELQGTAARLPG